MMKILLAAITLDIKKFKKRTVQHLTIQKSDM